MFIEVGLMLTVYGGVRFFEEHEDEQKVLPPARSSRQPVVIRMQAHARKRGRAAVSTTAGRQAEAPSDGNAPGALASTTGPAAPERSQEERLAELRLHRNVSAASVGFFALRNLYPPLGLLGLGSYIFSAIPYMRDVERQLQKERKVNVDVLFFLGDILTLGASQYFTAAAGLYLMSWGKYSVARAKNESSTQLGGLFERLPQKVWVLVDGLEVEVPLKEVKKSDVLVVESGGVIPVDGTIIRGMAGIDQRMLTGEAQPVEKEAGDPVFANTIVLTGRIQVRVEKSGNETTASQIGNALLHSTEFKTGVQLKGEEWADKATLPMLIGAAIMVPTMGPEPAAVFINAHIGNRIRLLAPTATLSHISHAMRHSILVKDGRVLENLHKIDTVLFDKTGTLTMEEPEVERVIARAAFTRPMILTFAATAEQKQNHPIARAILKKAREEGIQPGQSRESEYFIGFGIAVQLGDAQIRVGSLRFLEREDLVIPDQILEVQTEVHEQGCTLVLVAVGDEVAGGIVLRPRVRPEVKRVIARLRQQGIKHIAIVSGDHREPTRRLAESLGMDDYFHDVLPQDKADIVTTLQAKGRAVGFVGDGINDTIAMKRANASISLRGASTIAMDTAEIVLMNGDLGSLNELLELSEKLKHNLNRSLVLTLAPGVINLGGAFIFHYSILTSMVINAVFGSVAMWNATHIGKFKSAGESSDGLKPEPAGEPRREVKDPLEQEGADRPVVVILPESVLPAPLGGWNLDYEGTFLDSSHGLTSGRSPIVLQE